MIRKIFIVGLFCQGLVLQAQSIDLSGMWGIRLDRQDQGVTQAWFSQTLTDKIELPGVLTAQGYGDPVSMDTQWIGNITDLWQTDPYYKQYQDPKNFKMPFWLQPDRHYVGPVWYQRTIDLPQTWQGQDVTLTLERAHWETRVWLDQTPLGTNLRLGTAHVYDLGTRWTPGAHRLTIRVDNRMKINVGQNSHSMSDHTQGNWNGIVGRMALEAKSPVGIDAVRLFSSAAESRVTARVHLKGFDPATSQGVCTVEVTSLDGTQSFPAETVMLDDNSDIAVTVAMPAARPWDEFSPTLYRATVKTQVTRSARTYEDRTEAVFGLRDVATRGTQITLNGRPIFLRGTLECGIFPLTGHPPTEVDAWKRIIQVCKAHGLNHMRFHSWCPPEAAFAAADELGFYFQVECSSWANQGSGIGSGDPLDTWLYEEADAMLRAYGNHPSFLMMAYGNEPAGARQTQYLARFVNHYKKVDPRRLYTSAAGWPLIPENDFHSSPAPRIQQWGQGVRSLINGQAPTTAYDWAAFVSKYPDTPVVSHEIGQWCVYPNLAERAKYTGLLKARNFDIFADQLERHGMLDQAPDFLTASGKLQALCYKADIEAALRTPGFGGFQLLDLHDFPGQGTALVGILDPFWEEKGYITAAQFKGFCGPIVPLARMSKRIFESGDVLEAQIDLAQFGPKTLQDAQFVWRLLKADGQTLTQGMLPRQTVASGKLVSLGDLRIALDKIDKAQKFTLDISLPRTEIGNSWDVWVYPKAPVTEPRDILIATELNDAVQSHLDAGGRVLWLPVPKTLKDDPKHPITMGFSSIFWNTVWTHWQAPHTLGILCDPKHAALADFPTEFHSNWQWWDLVRDRQPFILTEHKGLRPVVQVIDDWVTARKLGLVFEVRVGRGVVLACASDLVTDLEERPVARQFRQSLLSYLASSACRPEIEMPFSDLEGLTRPLGQMARWHVTALADSEEAGYEAANAIDNDPSTLWHTAWTPQVMPLPHTLTLDLQASRRLAGFRVLPRQDMANGRVGAYEIYVSQASDQWGEPVVRGQWPNSTDWQEVRFSRPVSARYVKVVALREVRGQPYTAIAELEVLPLEKL
ncbi:MAG: discoidin domain-containing protein [Phycisphaerae bacterium]|nr:discoidin domain-containing protein [Phycisphaerae bacterium]